MSINIRRIESQRGSTLIVTLVLLLILTIMAIREVSFNSTLTRIATNAGDALVALSSTEGALNQAVNSLMTSNLNLNNFLANTNGMYTANPNNPPLWTTINWSSSSAVIQSYQGDSSARAAYFIEQLPSITAPGQSMKKPTLVFRITARGVGASGAAPVILQSIVQIPQ